jgi:predicted O-linked N-acetylglucosamine transferase (SPINDLY family)
LPTIDHYLSAEYLEPVDAQDSYTENLVRLPHLGSWFEPSQVQAIPPDLDRFGIDASHPVLLCPGTPFKYAPEYDWVLTEIARKVGRCRFVFFTHSVRNMSETLHRRLEGAFIKAGLQPGDYVTFVPWQTRPAFYGWLQRADIFLDTIGFSGFNTAMQAVECAAPIVTREGRFMRGRLASGILKRMGLQELVARSEEDYIRLAARLACDSDYRASIRDLIGKSRSILFLDIVPVRAFEDFLQAAAAM